MNDALWKRRKENSGDDIACGIQPAARQIGQDVPDFRLSTRLQAFAVYGPHSFKQTNKKIFSRDDAAGDFFAALFILPGRILKKSFP